MRASDFGNEFKWGVSTSAYQSEGAAFTDGKGLSIWDEFCTVNGKIYKGQTAVESCDFYNRFVHDLILMDFLGFRNFRFSISWPRLFPNGIGEKNRKGFDFYDRLIDICLEMNIEPWVTLYHWDLPLALEQQGGWINREIVNWFSEYVYATVKRYSDRVKNWMVLNEPLAFTGAGYFLGIHAPGKRGLSNFLSAAHHAVLCQATGGRIIKSIDSNLNVGTTFSTIHIDAADTTKLDKDAAIRMDALTNRMFVEPLLGMGYPAADLKILQQIDKYMHAEDEKAMQFKMDFIGIQNYTREIVKYSAITPYIFAKIIKAKTRNVPLTTMGWEIYPKSIYKILKKFAAYPGVDNIMITENGAAFNDILVDGKVLDSERENYYRAYLREVLKAKIEGVPVNGYFAWSFTDNFEWADGYRQRFGLVYVNYQNQRRYIKSSGHWFRKFLTQAIQEQVHQIAV